MAQAFARMHGGNAVHAESAGSRPSGVVNPRAVEFMAERGYDLSTHASKSLEQIGDGEWDAVVTMGCGDTCPVFPGKTYLDWVLEDPAGQGAALRQAEIDEIRARIEAANGKEVPKVQYAVGEEVKITDGAFTNLTGSTASCRCGSCWPWRRDSCSAA